MKKLFFVVFIICLNFASCSNDEDSMEEESQKLEKMHKELVDLSLVNSQTCTNAEEWDFVKLTPNACGENRGYIVYSKKINKSAFLAKVQTYSNAQLAFDKRWNIYISCDVSPLPSGAACVDGKVRLDF